MASKLQGKGLPELRGMARKLGINPAGKNAADLIREIEKRQKGNAGKGTAADPTPKGKKGRPATKAKKPVDEDEEDEEEEDEADEEEDEDEEDTDADSEDEDSEDDDEEDDEEDEEEEEKSKKGAKKVAKEKSKVTKSPIAQVLALINSAVDILMDLDKTGEEEDEESEEEETPKKKGKAPAKKMSAKSKKAKDDDDDEEDEDDEAGLEFTPEELASMKLPELVAVAKKLNKMGIGGKTKVDVEIESPRKLRQAITDFLNEFASKVDDPKKSKKKAADEEEEEDEDDDSEESADRPEFVRIGAKVECDLGEDDEEEWLAGAIETIDDDEESCHVQLDDGSECDAPWDAMRPLNRKAKKRK